ncbi:MAG TPA: hypothetical protein VG013_42760 [Gemmataceae bacterium]|jgi:hypothetical protein|nr:hypothetical protein [Gemmataceae bacterium]
MSTTQLTPVEPGHRIQLPADWAEALGLRGLVALERTTEGILVRPGPAKTWDDFFATKLQVGSAPQNEDIVEVSGDDLLF